MLIQSKIVTYKRLLKLSNVHICVQDNTRQYKTIQDNTR